MKADLVIIGSDPAGKDHSAVAFVLFEEEANRLLSNTLKFEEIRKLYELRKSCGVESKATSTVNVRLPARYLSAKNA
jgi:hypothetical protein